jgi:hypothetical protein
MVSTALPLSAMLFGIRCVTPSPIQVSSVVTLVACVVIVPFAWPHVAAETAVTVTAADPLFVGSAALIAVIVYMPALAAVNVADRPLGVSTPPAGDALHVTPPAHDVLALSEAVSVEVAPVLTVAGLALTATPLTVHVVELVGEPVVPLDPHAHARTDATILTA